MVSCFIFEGGVFVNAKLARVRRIRKLQNRTVVFVLIRTLHVYEDGSGSDCNKLGHLGGAPPWWSGSPPRNSRLDHHRR